MNTPGSTTADEQAAAFWAAVTFDDARCDHTAHMSPVEVRMLARCLG